MWKFLFKKRKLPNERTFKGKLDFNIYSSFLMNGILTRKKAIFKENLSMILDKIAAKIKSYPQLNNCSDSVVSI